jgi:hypothetical protein
MDVAEKGGNKQGWSIVARVIAPVLAGGFALDEIARAAGAWWLLEKVVIWLPPFARTHDPRFDLLASVALAVAAWVFLTRLRPVLPDELHGLGYLALLVAAALVVFVVAEPKGGPSAGRLTAGGSSTSQTHRPAVASHAKASHPGSARRARSSASAHAPQHSESSRADAATSTGSSSTTAASNPSNETTSHATHQLAASRPVPQTHPKVSESHSPDVEFEGSAPPKSSPAVEVKSEKQHASGIEIASN